MTTAASNYLENALVDYVLRNTGTPTSANVYLALFTTDPGEDASGTEVSGNGYARQATAFDAPANGVTQNTALESFTASGGNFGTVTHFAIFDALTVGNMLYYGVMTASKVINDGDTLEFAAGAVVVTLT